MDGAPSFPCFKGYYTAYGFLGWVEKLQRLVLFATIEEYEDYIRELEED